MTPLLSPGKTIEGALGGFLVAGVAACVYFQYVDAGMFGATVKLGVGKAGCSMRCS